MGRFPPLFVYFEIFTSINSPEMRKWLLGLTLDELNELAVAIGARRFVGAQLADWLYKKRADGLDRMTNLSLSMRSLLSEAGYEVGGFEAREKLTSADGTRKYLFPTLGGDVVECVMIPDGERKTLCVSSQAGCRMGCRFCYTARGGFGHSLTAGEIVNQFFAVDEAAGLTNAVFMGMGEPLDNAAEVLKACETLTAPWGLGWSPTRITVSTIGVLPVLEDFLRRTRVNLAVSLHSPFPEERAALMPMQKAYPIEEVLAVLRSADFSHQRRLSFEYIMFDGVNDSPRHAAALVRLLGGLQNLHVNLIRFHAIPDSPLQGSPDAAIRRFNESLNKAGLFTTTRSSRGEDILAACGLLAARKQ